MKFKNYRFFTILFICLITTSFFSSAQVTVGNGSYTDTFPGTDAAARNQFPSNAPQLSGDALAKPVPTNDWWSTLVKENHADNLFNYPMTLKTKNDGLIVTYIPWGPIGDSAPIEVGLKDLNASQTTVSDYSDWTVTMDWNDGVHNLQATAGIGMPFLYFEKDSDAIVEIKVNTGVATISNEILTIENATSGADFVVYAPTGSTWTQSGKTYISTLNGKDFWSIAMLPQQTANVNQVAQEFKKYAYVFPTNTATEWSYDAATSKVTTTFTVTTDVKEGAATNVLLGLLPHQWSNLATSSPSPEGPSYETVRGELKTLNGNSFVVENKFKGILPTLPNVAQFSDRFKTVDLNEKISLIKNDQLAAWTDSYNDGQVMNRLIQTARIADQNGDVESRDKMIATVKERLEDWLTYQSGEVAFLFYYNDTWSTMLGYPAGHGQDHNINDHHFHWGYFIHAAAFIEQFEPGWSEKWGEMVNLLVRDAASEDRNDPKFPFLRNFSPYAGHSWANGFATFPHGNDQESTSESMQFASSLIHWGSITENNAIRDLGIYIYTTEQTAIEEYWFDMNERNFKSSYNYMLVSRVWGNSYDFETFWTRDIAASYGIELYPIHGGSLYLAHNQSYAQSLWTEITSNTGILTHQENANLWHDTYYKYLSLIDASAALDLYEANPDRALKFGISDAQTYHWLHAMNALGKVDPAITADYPIAVAFDNNGTKTYVAHNYSDTPITVSFSDGFTLSVPENTMATNRDAAVTGTISADSYESDGNTPIHLTTVTYGDNISKVEFYNGETLLGEDTTAPYEFSIPNMTLGIHNIYSKIYADAEFSISNVITIQVGEQLPYLDNPHTIPGVIEAGHYDLFEGGLGQNVSYYDSSADNKGSFRPTEYVDAVAVNGQGNTVGWIAAGEWLEYTIDVQQTGCYDLDLGHASGNLNGGGPFHFEIDGVKVSRDIPISPTGGWTNWSNKQTTIDLTAGIHVLRLVVTEGEFNLAKMTFSYNASECADIGANTGLPFDFETTPTTVDFNNFDGGTATVEAVTAPQNNGNNSNNLAKIVRDGGKSWAGAYLNLNEPLNFETNKYMTLKVWTEAPIGTSIQLKLEQQSGAAAYSQATTTTRTGEWETLAFDFSSLGLSTYDKLVFMFDIGNVGDGSESSTFYFDDVQQDTTLGQEDFNSDMIQMYPNPVTSVLYINSKNIELTKVEIYSLLGQKLKEAKSALNTIQIEDLPNGIYFVKAYSGNRHIIKKMIKK